MKSPLVAPFGALLLLAGCSGQPQSEAKTTETTETKAKVEENKLPDTGGGEPIELTVIGKGELPRLDGELGCSFTIEGQSGPAFVAKANVGADQTAFGAYKIGGKVLRVAGPGGFSALEKGLELSGPGMKLTVERQSAKSKKTGTEQTSYPAKLIAARTYGGERSYDGKWTCGA